MSRIARNADEQRTLQKDRADQGNANTPSLAEVLARKQEVTSA